MNLRLLSSKSRSGVAAVLGCWVVLLTNSSGHGEEPPSATDLLARVMARASRTASNRADQGYCYSKRSRFQELDARDKVVNSKDKGYEVVLVQGWPFTRLVEVEGQRLTKAQLQKEERREEEFRNKVAGPDWRQRREKKEAWLTPELLARYHFTVLSNDVCQSRKTLVLDFQPKPANPEKTVQDRILNRFTGLLWIDSEEAEVTRVEAHLTGELPLGWLGALGSLSQCHLNFWRERMPEGVWVNTRHELLVVGRKLWSPLHFRVIEESSHFRRELPAGKANSPEHASP